MKGKQYSIKIYETSIEDEAKFIAFFDANHILFKDHLIAIHGNLSSEIEQYLNEKSLTYVHNITMPISKPKQSILKEREKIRLQEEEQQIKIRLQEEEQQKETSKKIEKLTDRLQNNLKVLDGIVRSGQEITIEGDLLLLNRVNSGATIHTTGNLIVTQVVEGSIRCDGNFMMLSNSPKANIIFHGMQVDNELLNEKLNRIELSNNHIKITPVLKKEINWASQ